MCLFFSSSNYLFLGFSNCSRLEQFEKYDNTTLDLSKKDRLNIEQKTGCLYPCSYTEYIVKGKKPLGGMPGFGLYLTYGTLSVTVKKEVLECLIFSMTNLITYLGLELQLWFVGF